MRDLALEDVSSMLIGYGAGNADRIRVDDRVANFPAIPKAIIEYGLIGGIPLLLLIMVRIFTGIGSLPIAVGLLCMQFFLSGASCSPSPSSRFSTSFSRNRAAVRHKRRPRPDTSNWRRAKWRFPCTQDRR